MGKKLLVQCQRCKDWFEPRTVGGPNMGELILSGAVKLSNNYETCKYCGKETLIDSSNVKVI